MPKNKPTSGLIKGPGMKSDKKTRLIWVSDTKISCSYGTFIKNAVTGVFEWVINDKVYIDLTDEAVKLLPPAG